MHWNVGRSTDTEWWRSLMQPYRRGRSMRLPSCRRSTNANVDVEIIDLSTLSDEQLWQVEEISSDTRTPLLQVFYPERNGQRKKCWEGELKSTTVRDWFESPLRQQITNDIVSGFPSCGYWSMDRMIKRISESRTLVTLALDEAESADHDSGRRDTTSGR